MYQLSQLANGCRIASAYLPSMSSVCVGVWAGTGSRHESAQQGGISHFIEHMLFKGAQLGARLKRLQNRWKAWGDTSMPLLRKKTPATTQGPAADILQPSATSSWIWP